MVLDQTVQSTQITEYHDCNQLVHHSIMHQKGKHRNPARLKREQRGNEDNRAVQRVYSNQLNVHSGYETSRRITGAAREALSP